MPERQVRLNWAIFWGRRPGGELAGWVDYVNEAITARELERLEGANGVTGHMARIAG